MTLPLVGEFIPPFPDRPVGRLPLRETIRRFRDNMIAEWPARMFDADFFTTKVLRRRLFVCNSPETVRAACVDAGAELERKRPQMRQALDAVASDIVLRNLPQWFMLHEWRPEN